MLRTYQMPTIRNVIAWFEFFEELQDAAHAAYRAVNFDLEAFEGTDEYRVLERHIQFLEGILFVANSLGQDVVQYIDANRPDDDFSDFGFPSVDYSRFNQSNFECVGFSNPAFEETGSWDRNPAASIILSP